jgi:hypothetical protein
VNDYLLSFFDATLKQGSFDGSDRYAEVKKIY